MKKTVNITNRLKPVPILLTDDMTDAMLLHSRKLKHCVRPNRGSLSAYARAAIIEKLRNDGLDMGKIDTCYNSMF